MMYPGQFDHIWLRMMMQEKELANAIKNMQEESTDYLKGYVDSEEDKQRSRLFNGVRISLFGVPMKYAASKKVLEEREQRETAKEGNLEEGVRE